MPPAPPLVSLIILTCNRPAYLRLALAAAESQTYPNLEAVVVDDGPTRPVPKSILKHQRRTPIRLVRLPARASIGEKRNAGFRAAHGSVILHWDDDDLHHPQQVAALACPIIANVSEITALTFSYLGKPSRRGASFFEWGDGRGGAGHPPGPFLGSLAYHRSVATSVATASAAPSPFADVSLSEDLFFVERALLSCNRMLPVGGIPLVYTRRKPVGRLTTPAGG